MKPIISHDCPLIIPNKALIFFPGGVALGQALLDTHEKVYPSGN